MLLKCYVGVNNANGDTLTSVSDNANAKDITNDANSIANVNAVAKTDAALLFPMPKLKLMLI